ncbi:hypothetical protein H2274_07145 [Campylobacter sp. W0049]|uniref:hypothetical protein n=1 Tax=Campylobacter molothri TaxID=1032242 RepID=UPI00301B70A2|nr:hypothetical protein [Campylobacter sp. W0049]
MERYFYTKGGEFKLRAEKLPDDGYVGDDLFNFLYKLRKNISFRYWDFNDENEFLIIKAFEIFSLIYYELKKKYKIELEIFRDKENKIFLKFGDKVKQIKKYTSMDYEKSLKFFERGKNA